MRTRYCPIDPRLDFTDTNRLLANIHPKHLIIPTEYSNHSQNDSSASASSSSAQQKYIQPLPHGRITHFSHLDVLKIPLERNFEAGTLHPELAMHLIPKESQFIDNAKVANVSAVLSVRDNQLELRVPSWTELGVLERSYKREIWGRPLVDKILQLLMAEDITGVRVIRKKITKKSKPEKEKGNNKGGGGKGKEREKEKEKEKEAEREAKEKVILHIDDLGAVVVLTEDSTEIRTDAENVRQFLKGIILQLCTDLSATNEDNTAPNNTSNKQHHPAGLQPPVIAID